MRYGGFVAGKEYRRGGIAAFRKKTVTTFLILAACATLAYGYTSKMNSVSKNHISHLSLSIHFDAWDNWRDAINNILNRPGVNAVKTIGIGAGRPEWVYFKWKGHEENWSKIQKASDEDILEIAAYAFRSAGLEVAVFVDIFGPRYIQEHPEAAAAGIDGRRHDSQVGFSELVEGDYGEKVLEMIEYLSNNYEIDIINLTETPYYDYSYNDKDLRSYESFTGKKGWPRDSRGRVNKDDRSIWEWKSALMEAFIGRAAEIVHSGNKKLYVDVPVSWKNMDNNGTESGLDYRRVMKSADNIVVWNYFYLNGLSPRVSGRISRHLEKNFPGNSFHVSIGMWGKNEIGVMDPKTLGRGIRSSLRGGNERIWITPGHLITDKHWKEIMRHVK